jgi:broad specificity phosphatase PhoE
VSGETAMQDMHGPGGRQSVTKVVLIRHAEVLQVPGVPTEQWSLSDGGKSAAWKLGHHPFLGEVEFFVAGEEPKMVATATACARRKPVVTSPDLRELNRDAVGWLSSEDAYLDLIRRILSHPNESVQGCESAVSARERVVKAIDEVLDHRPGETFAVVSGGLTLALYLSHLQGKREPDFALWKSIRFPDMAVVAPRENAVIHNFGSTTEI